MNNITIYDYTLPMRLVEECAKCYNEKIIVTIDKDYQICVYIKNIDRIKGKQYLSNLEGHGLTYQDACIDYICNLLDTHYKLRYKINFYATEKLRGIIKRTNFKDLYLL